MRIAARLAAIASRTPSSVILIPVSLAAGLGLFGLGRESLWLDEAYTWYFVQMSWSRMLEAVRIVGVHPPAYFLIVKLIIGPLGEGEAALRLPSVAFFLAGLVFVAFVGRRVGGTAGSLAAAWFWAFHPMLLWYARDARPYSLAACLSAFLLLNFLDLLGTGRRSSALLAAMTMALGLLTHYFFLVFVVALSLLAASEMRRAPGFFRAWAVSALAGILPFGLWLAWYLSQPNPSLGIGWIRPPLVTDIPATIWNLFSGYGGSAAPSATAFGVAASLLALAGVLRPVKDVPLRRLVGIGVILPVIGVWLVSQRHPAYLDRYFIVLVPIAAAAVGRGAAWTWEWIVGRWQRPSRRALATLGLTSLAFLGFLSAVPIHASSLFIKEDWRGISEYLRIQGIEASQVRLSEPEAALPLAYYEAGELEQLIEATGRDCASGCWLVARQPYTAIHAFSQVVAEPDRPWRPSDTGRCGLLPVVPSRSGVGLWRAACGEFHQGAP